MRVLTLKLSLHPVYLLLQTIFALEEVRSNMRMLLTNSIRIMVRQLKFMSITTKLDVALKYSILHRL